MSKTSGCGKVGLHSLASINSNDLACEAVFSKQFVGALYLEIK
jgi:hypothetical protein